MYNVIFLLMYNVIFNLNFTSYFVSLALQPISNKILALQAVE